MTTVENHVVDGAIATYALTLPLWVQLLEAWMAFTVPAITIILLLIRVILAWRELKKK